MMLHRVERSDLC